jgi:hypothetical protein
MLRPIRAGPVKAWVVAAARDGGGTSSTPAQFSCLSPSARERGELRADADLDLAVTMLISAYYAQYLAGNPFSPDWTERNVDTLLQGLLPRPT